MKSLLLDMAQIYQQRASESLQPEDLAHAKRYREAAEQIAKLESTLSTVKGDLERFSANMVAYDEIPYHFVLSIEPGHEALAKIKEVMK